MRRCLYDLFDNFGLADGYYKWSDEMFYQNANEFLKRLFNQKKSFPKEHIWIMVAMLYPKKAMIETGV
jgi:hypothetical protein